MKKFIDKYNTTDTLLVISLYPKKGELYSTGTSGLASYTKNVVTNLKRKVIVLGNYETKPTIYEENNTLVVRCFKFNKINMWLNIFNAMRHYPLAKQVLLQFDFAVYGNTLTTAFVIPFLTILALAGYQTSITLHHVITDIKKLSGHVGLGNGKIDAIKAFFYNTFFHLFYTLTNIFTSNIIVLEDILKNKLETVIDSSKITAIPHGVDTTLIPMDKKEARKSLGIPQDEHVIIFFGFINWFKGADIFAKIYNNHQQLLGKKVRCIIAGGVSATLKDKPYYQSYFTNVMQTVKASDTVEVTGYVPQEKIRAYFSAADLVVFPYRYFMTASGVLSLVFSYKKPFIISSAIKEMFDSPALQQALKETTLNETDFVFNLNKKSCLSLTRKVLKNGIKTKMRKFTQVLREERSYKNTALLYEQAIFPAEVPIVHNKIAINYTKSIWGTSSRS